MFKEVSRNFENISRNFEENFENIKSKFWRNFLDKKYMKSKLMRNSPIASNRASLSRQPIVSYLSFVCIRVTRGAIREETIFIDTSSGRLPIKALFTLVSKLHQLWSPASELLVWTIKSRIRKDASCWLVAVSKLLVGMVWWLVPAGCWLIITYEISKCLLFIHVTDIICIIIVWLDTSCYLQNSPSNRGVCCRKITPPIFLCFWSPRLLS